ncbi:MAG: Arylsulfatase regulator (Fe-S oxidoreductase) [Firmicutes bacterium]|nr:Arylsulfatase regulator (Fe-S oxidoreductase) [Bacillota bacterium]
MDSANGHRIKKNVVAFFEKEYPLIKLFPYGNELLVYDAKPHFVFILSNEEMEVLVDFLSGKPKEEILEIHAVSFAEKTITLLLDKFEALKSSGVFIKGPVKEISPIDRNVIKNQLMYYDENILLRKFCMEVTEDCNYRCTYCKRTIANSHAKHKLSEENAYKGIHYYFNKYIAFFEKLSAEKKKLLLKIVPPSLSWYGGEPFLNFELIKKSTNYFKNLPWDRYSINESNLKFTSNTNLSIMNDEILNFLVDNRVFLFASLDGPAEEHDKCRVFANGEGTFHTAYHNLLKIKEFNETYFKEQVSIFGVYTNQHDYDKCTDFTRNIGALLCQHFPAEYTGTFVANSQETVYDYRNSMNKRLANFKKKAFEAAQDQSIKIEDFANLFSFAKLNYDHPAGKDALQILLTCPMGFDNLMLAANGDFLICHKVDGSMPIGDCDSGLDYEKLIDLNQQYNQSINNDECKNCWNVNFCSVCAASRMADHHFFNPAKQECDLFRLRTTYDFLCFIHFSLEHPDLLKKIFAHRNDPEKYIGIIDINDF